jgi:hypothetical protein
MALVAAGLAVGLVAADTVWSLEFRIESKDASGAWTTRVTSEDDYFRAPGIGPEDCATPSLRLVVDNYKPLPDAVDVSLHYFVPAASSTTYLVDETWSLAPFEVRMVEATVPQEAFNTTQPDDNRTKPGAQELWVNAQADDNYAAICVRQEG